MLLGFDSFAALPISASGNEGNVTLSVTGNQLTINIGDPGITADSVTEIPNPNISLKSSSVLTLTGFIAGPDKDLPIITGPRSSETTAGSTDSSTSFKITPGDTKSNLVGIYILLIFIVSYK